MLSSELTPSDRIVCQFSCGASSAVAAKIMLSRYAQSHDVQVLNAVIKEEHQDNRRFFDDCQRWLGVQIVALQHEKYEGSARAVFRHRQFMKGQHGAPCTMILKRELLDKWKGMNDVMVLGYTVEETDRAHDLVSRNPSRRVLFPLIEDGLTKEDCKAMILRAGIRLPAMYDLGYANANCIGCVKGGMGYWRAIKEDFPDDFEEMAKIQDDIGEGSWFFFDRKTGGRISLRNLPEGKPMRNEKMPSCSFFCEMAEKAYS